MKTDFRRSVLKWVFSIILFTGLVTSILCIPFFWLAWEVSIARDKALIAGEVMSSHVQEELKGLLLRYERATSGVRIQDLQGDTISLTSRLLRAESLIAPASNLLVLNGHGVQVASSFPNSPAANAPVWWPYARSTSRDWKVTIIKSKTSVSDSSSWLLVRKIENSQDGLTPVIVSTVPGFVIEKLFASTGTPTDLFEYTVHDTDGQILLHYDFRPISGITINSWVEFCYIALQRFYIAYQPIIITTKVQNIVWTANIQPQAVINLQADSINVHGFFIICLISAILIFTLLISIVQCIKRRPLSVKNLAIISGANLAEDVKDRELKRLGNTIEDMTSKIQAITGERDRVLVAIGHDVRTPMNSILGICALLLDGDLDEAQRKWLRRIRASCEALLAMLNGMLEIAAARVEGGEIHCEKVDVAALVDEVSEVLRPQAEDKGLELQVVLEHTAVGLWNTDPTRLRQVLFNLVGNAVKYTIQGSVEVKTGVRKNASGQERLYIEVSDTGLGVAECEREIIFDQFQRGREEVSRGQEGLGLGLALCRNIATLLGGSLTLDTTRVEGSAFYFEIPIERAEAIDRGCSSLGGRTALVVGLSEGVRRRVASHLERLGFDVETAADGFVALGLAERTAFHHGILDLLVLDVTLPGLSADALLLRVRKSRPLERTRTVLVTNGPMPSSLEQQVDSVVSHPVETRDLDHVIAELFGSTSPLQDVDPRAPAAQEQRILVVEDNRINQALFVDVLNRAGFSAFTASSGEEAIEAVKRGGFDAVLMDVQMPGIDGIEATRRIRTGEKPCKIPIIGQTAHTGTVIRRKCLDAGMNLVLHKPVDYSRLALRLREVIAAAHFAKNPETDSNDAQTANEDSAFDIADEYLEMLIAEVGADRARNCITTFLIDTSAHIPAMMRFFTEGKWLELGQLSHSLAGVASTLGAVTLSDGLLLLEDTVRLGEDVGAASALKEVQTTWERTMVILPRRFETLLAERRGLTPKKAA